jgi:hypothetical protein
MLGITPPINGGAYEWDKQVRIKKDAGFKPHPYVQWLFPEKFLAFACTAPVNAPAGILCVYQQQKAKLC